MNIYTKITSWEKMLKELYNDKITHKTCTDEEWTALFDESDTFGENPTEFYAWSKDYVYVPTESEYNFSIERFPRHPKVKDSPSMLISVW